MMYVVCFAENVGAHHATHSPIKTVQCLFFNFLVWGLEQKENLLRFGFGFFLFRTIFLVLVTCDLLGNSDLFYRDHCCPHKRCLSLLDFYCGQEGHPSNPVIHIPLTHSSHLRSRSYQGTTGILQLPCRCSARQRPPHYIPTHHMIEPLTSTALPWKNKCKKQEMEAALWFLVSWNPSS